MARDIYHFDVKEALESDGWTVTHDPLVIKSGGIKTEVDLAAEQVIAAEKGEGKIAVEVKSFLSKSKLTDFYEAKGKYDIYLRLLKKEAPDRILFLAIEEEIFNTFFQKPLIKEVVLEEQIAIIVFSHHTKRILQWIK